MAEQISDGLKKEVLKPGSGDRPNRGDTITVQCTGSLNGTPPKKFWRYIAQRSATRCMRTRGFPSYHHIGSVPMRCC